jgi:hypothetical protein
VVHAPSAAAAGAALCGTAAPDALTAAPAAAAGAAPSRVRQAEPQAGSRVTVTVAATFDIKGRQGSVAAYRDSQPWSEPWEQPGIAMIIAWRRRHSYARYVQPSTKRRSV